jgi:hypothetical protein
MDTFDETAEFDALKRRAEELRKELSLDQQPDKKSDFLRDEVQGLEALNEMRLRLLYPEEQKNKFTRRRKKKP